MKLDNPLNLNFDDEELSSSTYGSVADANACDTYSKQVAVYRAQYMEVVLENNELQREVLLLREEVLGLKRLIKEVAR